MEQVDTVDTVCDESDIDQDECIEKNEVRTYVTDTERLPSPYETSSSEVVYDSYGANRIDQNTYVTSTERLPSTYETSTSAVVHNDYAADRIDQNTYVTSTARLPSTYETSTSEVVHNDYGADRIDQNTYVTSTARLPSTYETSTSAVVHNDYGADRIDQNTYVTSTARLPTTYETSTSEVVHNDYGADRIDQNTYVTSTARLPSTYETSTSEVVYNGYGANQIDRHKHVSYGTVAVASDVITQKAVIQTHSIEETNRYLETAMDVYKDPHPQVIRRTMAEHPVTYEQRVLVRSLQPPEVPPPGPLIVKEVRSQLPPRPPLVIRQYAPRPPTPPPLILRERPPTPPPHIHSETVVRNLPPLPPPPLSVIIERYPAPPPKPRDIIIERWIPYGHQHQRRTIVESVTADVKYPEPRNKIIIYEGVDARVHRHFEKHEVVRGDPAAYVARYGASLLDSATLVQRARHIGIQEDISPPAISSLTHSTYASIQDKQHTYDNYYQRRGIYFDFVQSGLFPADYVSGTKIYRKFVRPASFSFPATSMWSTRIAKYKENAIHGRVESVTVELIENGQTVHSLTIRKNEYQTMSVTSSAPKLAWGDFLQVLKVFMLGSRQESESDIARAFDLLDQGRRGIYARRNNLPDGLISPDELRAFLSILTDEYRVDVCVYLADIDGSGQINLLEFTRMVKSGLGRDIICGRV